MSHTVKSPFLFRPSKRAHNALHELPSWNDGRRHSRRARINTFFFNSRAQKCFHFCLLTPVRNFSSYTIWECLFVFFTHLFISMSPPTELGPHVFVVLSSTLLQHRLGWDKSASIPPTPVWRRNPARNPAAIPPELYLKNLVFFLFVLLSAYAHVLYCRVCAFQWACYLFCAIIEITDQPANQRHLAFQVQLFWVFYFLDGWTCSFWLCAGSISAELLDWFDG